MIAWLDSAVDATHGIPTHTCSFTVSSGYAVLVEKAGLFSVGQVLIVYKKKLGIFQKCRLFPKLPGLKYVPSIFDLRYAAHCFWST
jgi:hypothetical protein